LAHIWFGTFHRLQCLLRTINQKNERKEETAALYDDS
jgi:hypothetical protein